MALQVQPESPEKVVVSTGVFPDFHQVAIQMQSNMDHGEGVSMLQQEVSAAGSAREKSIGVYCDALGMDHGEGVSMLQQQVSAAGSAREKSIGVYCDALGMDHGEGVSVLQQEVSAAGSAREKSIGVHCDALGMDHGEGVSVLQQEVSAAGSAREKSIGVHCDALGIDHGEGVSVLQQEVSAAGSAREKSIGVYCDALGIDHGEGVSVLQQEVSAAGSAREKSIGVHCDALGMDHEEGVSVLQQEVSAAGSAREKSIGVYCDALGMDHGEGVSVLQQEVSAAGSAREKSIGVYCDALGIDHGEGVSVLQQEVSAAGSAREKSIGVYCDALGMDHGEGVSVLQQEVSAAGSAREKSIGVYCDALGILENAVIDIVCGREVKWTKMNSVSLVNGVVVELTRWLKKQRKNVKVICKVVDALFDVDELSDDQQRNMQRRVETVFANESKMRKRLKTASARKSAKQQDMQDELDVFERSLFDFRPRVREREEQSVDVDVGDTAVGTSVAAMSVRDDEVGILRFENERLKGKFESVRCENDILKDKLDDVRTKYQSERGRVGASAKELIRVREENKQLGGKNEKSIAALEAMTRDCEKAKANVRERDGEIANIRRRKTQLVEIREQLRNAKKTLRVKERELKAREPSWVLQKYRKNLKAARQRNRIAKQVFKKSEKKLEDNLAKVEKLRKQKRTLLRRIREWKGLEKARIEKGCEEKKATSRVISELRKGIRDLKDKLCCYDLEYEGKSMTFKDKQTYNPKIREVYQDLIIKQGVSSTKCEGVVRTVLAGLTHIPMENVKLPKATSACNMLLEGRKIAQVQVARALVEGEDLTVASDATTKFGHHFSSYDVYKGSDDRSGPSAMTIGVRESEGGTAQTALDTLLSILQEVSDMPGSTHTVQKMIANIKNTMSDRHIAEKKFNCLLRNYRETILPNIVKGWDDMDSEEQTKFASMNDFYCGLHYLVGLADYSSTAIQAWERMIFGDDKVGAEAVRGVHVESGCGTVRLVRSVCKAVQDRGCQETGKPLQFRSFLRTKGITSVPLAPFKGNRFNIIFRNGAGVFFLAKELKEFCEEQSKEGSQLFRSVRADLGVNQYLAAVRALGLIDKLVTGPLWKVINEPGHIATMNKHYTSMHSCFERWSNDSSKFMRGEDVLFEGKHDPSDPIFTALATPNPELDPMTKQVLEVLFLTYCQVTERMLKDHLPSGKHSGMGKEKAKQTKSVPKTNVGVERDFGMLDRLMRLKPSASMMFMESIIMGVRNKTSEWRKGLSVTDREELMAYARKSVKTQRDEYAKRVKQLWDERAAKRKSQQQKAEESEEKKRLRTESVYATVAELCGGIWMSEKEVHESLQGESEKKCNEMLQAQLQARRHVFRETNIRGRLNVSERGRKKNLQELKKCLLGVIQDASERSEQLESRAEAEYASMCASEEKLTEYRGRVEEKQRKTKSPAKGKGKNRLKYDEVLVGKIVDHLTVGESGQEEWHRAIVTSRTRNGVKLSYDSEPTATYEYTRKEIEDNLDNRDLKMAKLSIEDIVGRDINHRFEIDDEVIWYRGYVCSATKRQECLVMYDPVGEEWDEMESSWEGPILEDYENDDVRFVRPI